MPAFCERNAFVTFLMMNDSYLPGALLVAHQLRSQWTRADLACLVTDDLGGRCLDALDILFDRVIVVEQLFVPHARRQARQDRPFLMTRLHALRLGRDGDLGCAYHKVVVLDADVLPLKRFDHLFLLDPPAGVLNERKAHLRSVGSDRRYRLPAEVEITGCWIWHRLYGAIGHGARIPGAITLRVLEDPTNLGVNTALLVLRPSAQEYREILADLERPQVRRLVSEVFDWPDMQYLTLRWSGRWTNVDACFCGIGGYPSLGTLCGTHFAGPKPWAFARNQAALEGAAARRPDFRYWYARFLDMMESYPALRDHPRLATLARTVEEAATAVRADGSRVSVGLHP